MKNLYLFLKARLEYARFKLSQYRQQRRARKNDPNIYPLY
jgi:hypothetical protein